MPDISLPQSWLMWGGFIATVIIGLAIRDFAADLIAAWKWKKTPGFEPMETCILDGEKVLIIHIGIRDTIFERDGPHGRTWEYVPSGRIQYRQLRRIVGDDKFLDDLIRKNQKKKAQKDE